MGLVAKNWCERRQADPGMASGSDNWTYNESYNLHDELFYEALRPMDDSTFAYIFVRIPGSSDGQPFGDIGPDAPIVVDRVAQQRPWCVGA